MIFLKTWYAQKPKAGCMRLDVLVDSRLLETAALLRGHTAMVRLLAVPVPCAQLALQLSQAQIIATQNGCTTDFRYSSKTGVPLISAIPAKRVYH
jgi:hypothetical protein